MRKGTIGSIIGLLLTSWALYTATGYSRHSVCCSYDFLRAFLGRGRMGAYFEIFSTG